MKTSLPERTAPLNVAQVTWSLKTGGLEMMVLDLVRLCPEFSVRPMVAVVEEAGDLAGEVTAMGVPFVLLGKRRGIDPGLVRRLASLVREYNIDLLHAHNQGAMFYCGLAGLLTRIPAIYTRHGASFGRSRRHQRLSRLASAMARRVVCVGQDALEVTLKRDRVPRAKARLIYNGADLDRFGRDTRLGAEVRAELGIGLESPVVMSVGRLSPEKDQVGMVRAMAQVPDTWLVLVGEGEERGAIEAEAEALGISNRVILTGVRRDVARLLCAADVFALSSLSEGVSIAALEAMAAGLPMVATNVGGNPEIVRPGVTGLLVEPGEPRELATALGELLADPERARSMGRAGRALAEERFSLRAMVGAYCDLYREVVQGRAGGGKA